ncbi:hypothetical protein PGT21_033793 [Puccinia graminis f. sp. tritici]|uniref:Protein CPL1-like domain-containing protein n=1 Tax=Puccinia graminis f. sp. tritici TaxID=56615 RepID=A0A5B0M8L8_PUCGR|nr:hypothetical protein PGTUg99_009512 [Puccinia graminis f. sp. tritici]KAA1084665.1 hypothetical protein PGT21_033793 [Puccinia graminis f. sp. tritici]
MMLKIQSFILLALFRNTSGFELPTVPLSPYGDQAASRQVNPLEDVECGLNYNVWGQISPTSTTGHANLCLQCRITAPGRTLSFSYVQALSTTINAHGVSKTDALILQSSIDEDLVNMANKSQTSASCESTCSGDERCASCEFTENGCKMTAVDYMNENHAGKPLAEALESCFASGGSKYCGLCPNDRSCVGSRASGPPRTRRNLKSNDSSIKCPSGLTACPLSSRPSFKTTAGFECLDIKQDTKSCGGCVSAGSGVDCSTLEGVASSGCSDGKCKIHSCKSEYEYSEAGNECLKIL